MLFTNTRTLFNKNGVPSLTLAYWENKTSDGIYLI